jgi:hypothetical protein
VEPFHALLGLDIPDDGTARAGGALSQQLIVKICHHQTMPPKVFPDGHLELAITCTLGQITDA